MINWNFLCNQLLQELETDRYFDDVTAVLLKEKGDKPAEAVLHAKDKGVFYGTAPCRALESVLRSELKVESNVVDGQSFTRGGDLVRLKGPLRLVLGVERTLINMVAHLSGVATLTRLYVDAVSPYPTRILATRKTLPGLRDLQLDAVRAGGGHVHRRSLSDGILIKENHQEVVGAVELIRRARVARSPLHRIEVEVQSMKVLAEVLQDPPELLMLDNFTFAEIKEAMALIKGRCEVEVSGGVDVEAANAIAGLGVQYISVGRLTHSARSVDMSLDVVQRGS